jgi:hypothetical protein
MSEQCRHGDDPQSCISCEMLNQRPSKQQPPAQPVSREGELLSALHQFDVLLEQLDEAMASPEEIERDTKAVGGFVSGLNLTYGAETILKKAIKRVAATETRPATEPPSCRECGLLEGAHRFFQGKYVHEFNPRTKELHHG